MNDNVEKSDGTAGEIVLYQPDEKTTMEVRLDATFDTVWLTQQQIAELFGVQKAAISKQMKNIFSSCELIRERVVSKMETTASDGKKYQVDYYNLDMILSVGYRVNSVNATRFRQWANTVLKQYLLQGYSINRQMVALQQHVDDRLLKIEDRLDRQQEDIDFYIKTNQQPSELVIPTGCVWDAYSYLSGLVRTAKKRVVLIDNFVDDRTLLLLDKRAAGVEATVYTRYSEKAELDFAKHNAQYEPVQHVQLPHAAHDRYLVVDDDVWLLGSSVKDMGRGLTTNIHTEIDSEYILSCVK